MEFINRAGLAQTTANDAENIFLFTNKIVNRSVNRLLTKSRPKAKKPVESGFYGFGCHQSATDNESELIRKN